MRYNCLWCWVPMLWPAAMGVVVHTTIRCDSTDNGALVELARVASGGSRGGPHFELVECSYDGEAARFNVTRASALSLSKDFSTRRIDASFKGRSLNADTVTQVDGVAFRPTSVLLLLPEKVSAPMGVSMSAFVVSLIGAVAISVPCVSAPGPLLTRRPSKKLAQSNHYSGFF